MILYVFSGLRDGWLNLQKYRYFLSIVMGNLLAIKQKF